MKRVTQEFRTEFTVGNAGAVPREAAAAAKAFDAVGEAAKKAATGQEFLGSSSRAAIAGVLAVSAEMRRVVSEFTGVAAAATDVARNAATGQVNAAKGMAAGLRAATKEARDHYDGVAAAAKAAVRAAEDAGRLRIRALEGDLRGDEESGEDRVVSAKRRLAEAKAARDAMKAPKVGASRSEVARFEEYREAADFLVKNYEDAVRQAERSLAKLKRETKDLLDDAVREEAEKLRAVREAEDQKVAAAKRTVNEARRLEAEQTLNAQREARARAKAAEDEAKARARAVAQEYRQNAREVDRVSKQAAAAYQRHQAKRPITGEVDAALRDPEKARAAALEAARNHEAKLKALAENSAEWQARLAGDGSDPALAKKATSSLAGSKGAVTKAEAEARRTADVVKEMEKRLAEAEAAAKKAGTAIEAAMSDARKGMSGFAGQRAFARDLATGLLNPRQAIAMADAYAKAHEKALARVVAAAIEAKLAISLADPAAVADVTKAEAAKVAAAQDAAKRMADLARRTGDVAREVSRRQEKAAQDAARANEVAARRSAEAWQRAQERLGRVQRALPSLLGNRPGGVLYRLQSDGALSFVGGIASRILGVAGAVFSVAGTAGRLAFGAITGLGGAVTGLIGLAGRAAGGILSIGASAVTAAGRMALHLGTSAVALLGRLAGAAGSAAAKVAGIARTIVIRAVVVGAGAAVAGYGLAKKAVGDAAENAKGVFDGAVGTNTSFSGYQQLTAAAKRAGVDMAQFNEALSTAQGKMANIAEDPALLNYFNRLGVGTRTWDGRLRDTSAILRDLLPRTRQLYYGESVDLLERLFGSRENVERMLPLIRGIADANNSLLTAGARRQMQLGNLVSSADIERGRAYTAATYDLQDAWQGMKLAVSRAVGADVIRGMVGFADWIARSRFLVADFAKKAFSAAAGVKEILVTGRDMRPFMRMDVGGARFVSALFAATFHARRLAVAAWDARGHLSVLGTVAAAAGRVAMSTVPFWREAWAAITGQDAKVNRFTWMLDVQRTARDMWRTIRGRDDEVAPGHRWMLAVKADLFAVGRFAREAWRTVRGDTAEVTEFPILLRIRSGVAATFEWVKAFGREAWTALTGGDASVTDRFPWMQDARTRVVAFVADTKAAWADLVQVWSGGAGTTALGRTLQRVVADVTWARETAGKAWEDLSRIFAGDIGASAKFNFPWLKELAQDAQALGKRIHEAWKIFSAVFAGIDNTIQRFTFGKLDLATVAMTAGLLTLFGVTRTVIGGFGLAVGAAERLAAAWKAAQIAAVGGTGAAAAGAAGGLTGAMGAAGRAATESARQADRATTAWGKFKEGLRTTGAMIAQNPGLVGGALGVAGLVGGAAVADGSTSVGGKMLGGAMQGAGTGAMLGSLAGWKGMAIGGAIGGVYGAYSGYRSYDHEAALDAKLKAAGRQDLVDARAAARDKAARPAAAAPASDGTTAYDIYAQPGAYEITSAQAEGEMGRALDELRTGLRSRISDVVSATGEAVASPLMTETGGERPSGVAAALARMRADAMTDPSLAPVRDAQDNIRRGRIPSPAEFARGLIGSVPPADIYKGTSSDLYWSSPYSRSPLSAPRPAAEADRGAPTIINLTMPDGTKVKAEATQTKRQKGQFLSDLQRIAGMPASGAAS